MTTDPPTSDYGRPSTSAAAAPPPPSTLANEDLPCAFWDALPTEGCDHPDLLAIEALKAESTPAEQAEVLKSQANDALRRGTQLRKKFYLREALTLYTKALALVPERKEGAGAAVDEEAAAAAAALRITLLSNRAQAHLTLENNRAALEDAVTAGVADSANGKAHYRAARAAVRLGDWTAAAAAVERGLAAVPADPDFLKLRASVREQQATRDAADAAVAAAAASARAPARELAALVASRGVRVGLPQFSAAIGTRRPWVPPGSRLLHWPVLFAYPEAGPGASPDVVEAVPESEALGPHLDAVFAPDAPPLPWDGDSAYTRASVELYYLSHATKPLSLPDLAEALHGGWPDGVVATPPERYGPRAAHWVKVENVEGESLGALLSRPDMVVPGVPVFFVLAKGTAFRERWLEAAAE